LLDGIEEYSMTTKKLGILLSSLGIAFATSGAMCGGDEDACVAAKQHMCDKIPDMGCSALYMDSAQQKIIDACGQAELAAYVPVVQSACSAAKSSGVAMDCNMIAGNSYAGPSSGGGTCDAGPPMSFSYGGTSTADGRSAQLQFTVSGTAVTGGSLYASAVCTSNVHLNSTNIAFTGTLSGSWESPTGSISASWTGGDYACDGTRLSPDMGYPTSGSLTITMAGSKVQLQRIISNAQPYEFSTSGRTYSPPTICSAPKPDGSGGSGGSSGGNGGSSGGNGGSTGSDARTTSDALGPVCTKLALCCPTITDIPGLQSDCYTTLSNGLGDSGCQITWNSLTRFGYCEGL
jgi:hypothetical protein